MSNRIFSRNIPDVTQCLSQKCIGIAGCGGLGSNAAVALARSGIGKLILVDFDVVMPSNLNRQHYFQADIGMPKVDALEKHLHNINPYIKIHRHNIKLSPENIHSCFLGADLLVEAFDKGEEKKWLIESWSKLFPDRIIICGNGLSGLALYKDIKVQQVGKIIFCGDGKSQLEEGLCATKVAIIANLQAHTAIRMLWQKSIPESQV